MIILALLTAVSFAQTTELNCLHVTPIEMRFLDRHVNFTKNTPELQKRTIDQFMKRYDPSKEYALESDIKEVSEMMKDVFEKVKRLDCGPLIKANDILVKRVEERTEFVRQYLGPNFKFDKTAKIIIDAEKRKRPTTTAEANKMFAASVQWEVGNYLANDFSLASAKKHVLQSHERNLKHMHDLKNKDLFANYLDIYAESLDPHSNYMSADGLDEFEIQMRLSLDGIGATLQWKDGFTTIEALIPGGAAANSGMLKRRDKIVGVGQGEVGPFVDVMDMELKDTIKLIRGPKGTPVRLQVMRKVGHETQRLEVKVVRDKIKLEEAAASINYINQVVDGQTLKVGLLNLPSFYHDERKDGPTATSDLKRLLQDATKSKADVVVLDLSGNGGGSLPDAVDVAGLFIAKGNVVRLGKRSGPGGTPWNYETLADNDPSVDWSGPLVVLTNRDTASASEIVSGALQDYGRAVIVGADHTFGKGTMQSVEGLVPGLGATKTTTGMFFTAGGQSTQHRGVSGDIVLPSTLSQEKIGEKTLDYSLPPKKIDAFQSPEANTVNGPGAWTPVNKKLIGSLAAKSKVRVAKSEDFKKIVAEMKKNKKPQKYLTVASLFKAKTKHKEKSEEEEDDEEKPPPSKEEKLKAYLSRADIKEGINVAADLVMELRGARSPSSK